MGSCVSFRTGKLPFSPPASARVEDDPSVHSCPSGPPPTIPPLPPLCRCPAAAGLDGRCWPSTSRPSPPSRPPSLPLPSEALKPPRVAESRCSARQSAVLLVSSFTIRQCCLRSYSVGFTTCHLLLRLVAVVVIMLTAPYSRYLSELSQLHLTGCCSYHQFSAASTVGIRFGSQTNMQPQKVLYRGEVAVPKQLPQVRIIALAYR